MFTVILALVAVLFIAAAIYTEFFGAPTGTNPDDRSVKAKALNPGALRTRTDLSTNRRH